MGQEILLKIDMPVKSSAMAKNQATDKTSGQESSELQSFSTALDKQLEKQPEQANNAKLAGKAEPLEKVESTQKNEIVAEELVTEDGNILPEIDNEDINHLLLNNNDEEVFAEVVMDDNATILNTDSVVDVDTKFKPNGSVIEVDAKLKPNGIITNVAVENKPNTPVADVISTIKPANNATNIAVDIKTSGTVINDSKAGDKSSNVIIDANVNTSDIKTDELETTALATDKIVLPKELPLPASGQFIRSATMARDKEDKPQLKTVTNNNDIKAPQLIETLKSSVVAESNEQVKGLSSDQKQQGPLLRSDILNALNKKMNSDGDTIKVDETVMKTEKTLMAQSLDKPLNDVRKMAELLNQQKTDSPLLRSVPERGAGGFATALMSGITSSAATTAVQTASASQPVLAMQPSMQSEAWGKVLSSRVVWMAREGVQQAELRLNPANLGPVEVKLHMNNDLANVTFIAQNAATRDALEQALPRLRESFQENGMELANADVSDQETEQSSDEDGSSDNASTRSTMAGDELDDVHHNDSIESGELELGVSVFA